MQCKSLDRLNSVLSALFVIDKIKSVLNQFYIKTMKNYGMCQAMFEYLVQIAKRIIFMDSKEH
jgi:Origin of replication binding protein